MILQNLTKAIREQNYYAVVLEFLIVIAGVVIGFQITAWNETLADRERAEVLTERLIADMRAERWRIEGTSNYYAHVADNAERAIQALEGDRIVDDETLVIEAFRATQIFNFPVIQTTYNELVSTGTVDLVEDKALISAAVEYYEAEPSEFSLQDPTRPYRFAFFQIADRTLYDVLASTCAEPTNIEVGDYEALDQVLNFPCDIEGHDAAITALAGRLRGSESIIPLLRQRAVEASRDSQGDYFQNLFDEVLPQESP